ncbi:MAG TPA: hypothetical protein VK939_02900 [Longimicrobiales bacterium]|nr:hypothetical protein [Longimicrobiales bacterium]
MADALRPPYRLITLGRLALVDVHGHEEPTLATLNRAALHHRAGGGGLATVSGRPYAELPEWFRTWEGTGLVRFEDHDGDGIVRMAGPAAALDAAGEPARNELTVDPDIIGAREPGDRGAAKRNLKRDITERGELIAARIAAGAAVIVAGYLGVRPPGFVAEVVAFAFGLAASSFFPVIVLGIFSRRMNRHGAILGMISGITFTAGYIVYFKFVNPAANTAAHWWLGISPEGIGAIGMLLNLAVAITVSRLTPPPSPETQRLIDSIRVPRGAGPAHEIEA